MDKVKTINPAVLTPAMYAAGERAFSSHKIPYLSSQLGAAFSAMIEAAPVWPEQSTLDKAAQDAFDRGLKAGNEQAVQQQQAIHKKQGQIDELTGQRDRLANLLEIVAREALNSIPKGSQAIRLIRAIMLDYRAGAAYPQPAPIPLPPGFGMDGIFFFLDTNSLKLWKVDIAAPVFASAPTFIADAPQALVGGAS